MKIENARAETLGAELAALAAKSYAPYSSFHVAAIAVTDDGRMFPGVNVENASYGVTLCAEASALSRSVTEGGFDKVGAIAIIGGRMNGGVLSGDAPVLPCGRCRQMIYETASLQGRDIDLLCFSGDRTNIRRATIRELFPDAFGPGDLA